jgi:hypothetical protein
MVDRLEFLRRGLLLRLLLLLRFSILAICLACCFSDAQVAFQVVRICCLKILVKSWFLLLGFARCVLVLVALVLVVLFVRCFSLTQEVF